MEKKIKAADSESRLERHVRLWLNRQGVDYDDGADGALKDLMHGGCQSGFVGELIYHTDTAKFYKRYKQEIHAMLRDSLESHGIDGPAGLFGDKWDKEDPLADDWLNQNLLAWFGFEETARNIGMVNDSEHV